MAGALRIFLKIDLQLTLVIKMVANEDKPMNTTKAYTSFNLQMTLILFVSRFYRLISEQI